jgi:hypothetical protein
VRVVTEVQESNMKLPYIKKATWEKELYPGAKWIVVEREYNTYDACMTLCDAIRYWLWYLGVPPKIAFKRFKKKRNDKD